MDLDFSIIIPTKNRLTSLKEVLKSIENQKKPPSFELIVINDGSVDGTKDFLENYKPNYPFIFRTQEPKGPSRARNLGIELSRGRVVLFFGDDTILKEDCLKEHFYAQEKNSFSIAVLGRVYWHKSLKITRFMDYINEYGLQFGYKLIENKEEVPFNFFYTSNISLPKNPFLTKEKFDESFPFAAWEDIEFAYRLFKIGLKIKYFPSAIVYHNHPTNIKSFMERQYKSGISAKIFYKKHPELGDFLGIPLAKNLKNKKPLSLKIKTKLCIFFERFPIPLPFTWYREIMEYVYLKGLKDGLNG